MKNKSTSETAELLNFRKPKDFWHYFRNSGQKKVHFRNTEIPYAPHFEYYSFSIIQIEADKNL